MAVKEKRGIDLSSALGMLGGVGCLVVAIYIEFNELNPDLGSVFLQVSALMIIIGGTVGTVMLATPLETFVKFPQYVIIAFTTGEFKAAEFVNKIMKLADLARREGVLRLEQEIKGIEEEDAFLANGLRLVVDGVEPQVVEDMLGNEIETMEERHKAGAEMFGALGGFAPTMGIVGTVVGLISALSKAGEGGGDPNAIVAAIAGAFIATFYGIGLANLVFLPIGNKLKAKNEHEVFIKRVELEAIQAIQSGENPRVIYAKLAVLFQKGVVPPMEK